MDIQLYHTGMLCRSPKSETKKVVFFQVSEPELELNIVKEPELESGAGVRVGSRSRKSRS